MVLTLAWGESPDRAMIWLPTLPSNNNGVLQVILPPYRRLLLKEVMSTSGVFQAYEDLPKMRQKDMVTSKKLTGTSSVHWNPLEQDQGYSRTTNTPISAL